jgi:hypothetical protein
LTQDAVPSEFTNSAAKEYFIKILKDELNLNFDEVFEQWDDQRVLEHHKCRVAGASRQCATKHTWCNHTNLLIQ